jgi:hypothetical protein
MAVRWSKARWLFSLLVVVVVLGLVTVFGRTMIRNGVNRANYNRIEVGMTEAEVQAIMGRPSSELPWLDQDDIVFDERPDLLLRSPPEKGQFWQSGQHQLSVWYDASAHVVSKYYTRHPEVGIFQRFLDWLGL